MQGIGFALVASLRRLACGAGWHDDEPVSVSFVPGHESVLLRCEWCERERALAGAEAAAWITRVIHR